MAEMILKGHSRCSKLLRAGWLHNRIILHCFADRKHHSP